MDGILLVDKPQAWTSNDVCQYIKKKFGFKKVGHAGTLDPNATGLLVVLLNKATKDADSFIQDDKDYEGVLSLGFKTNTGDVEGTVVEEKGIEGIAREDILRLMEVFKGRITQVPPMMSALKKNGVRLYKLARAGKVIEREPREVTVHNFRIDEITLPFVHFFISVSKGFYVRSLAEDVGERLGCGATLSSLRRVRSGEFSINAAVRIDAIRTMGSEEDLRCHVQLLGAHMSEHEER